MPLPLKSKARLNRLEFVPARFEKSRPTIKAGVNVTELDARPMAAREPKAKKKKLEVDNGGKVGKVGKVGKLEKADKSGKGKKDRGDPSSPRSPRSPGGSRIKTRSQDELFPREELCMQWTKMRRVGSGLTNLGNTCFMNSVLQCLIHTPALAELLLSRRNLAYKPAAHGELDPIGMTQRLVEDSLEGKKGVVSPVQHAKSLKRINRGFRLGRQEDAHEYLIALLDAMHDRSIAGMNPKPNRELEYTSFIYQIFGGRIRSQIKCTQCDYESNTYDPFLDLSLEISRAHSVQKALQRFTASEVLDGQNSYKCSKQNKMVKAVKRMTIEDAPNTLIIQLKRFEFSRSGRKISKQVEFDETIDLAPFMSHPQPKGSALYDLYGILVHDGFSMHSGHYYSFLRNVGGDWHRFDDSRVAPTSARNAMGQQPYILFYAKRSPVAAAMAAAKDERANKKKTDRDREREREREREIAKTAKKKRKSEVESKSSKRVANLATPVVASVEKSKKASKKAASSAKSSAKLATAKPRAISKKLFSPTSRAPVPASMTPIAQSKSRRGYSIRPKTHSIKKSSSKKRKADMFEARDDKDDATARTQNAKTAGGKKSVSKSVSKRGADAINATKIGNRTSMGLDTWDTVDSDTKKQRDVNMRKSGPSRGTKPDAYDADYDKGRLKKTKKKAAAGEREAGASTSKLFDAFQKTVKKGKNLVTNVGKKVGRSLGGGKKRKRN